MYFGPLHAPAATSLGGNCLFRNCLFCTQSPSSMSSISLCGPTLTSPSHPTLRPFSRCSPTPQNRIEMLPSYQRSRRQAFWDQVPYPRSQTPSLAPSHLQRPYPSLPLLSGGAACRHLSVRGTASPLLLQAPLPWSTSFRYPLGRSLPW